MHNEQESHESYDVRMLTFTSSLSLSPPYPCFTEKISILQKSSISIHHNGPVSKVEPIVKKAIEENLGKIEYHGKQQLEQLSDKVHDHILKTLVNDVKKPFKYIVTVTLVQKNGAGMVSFSRLLFSLQSTQ